ncbi:hypothetical protein VTN31DRAFT_3973 [Thermomyces dupontii]|uniref:uncharacterized protein n=1 Tax=Talaromyces thermophilus TaxID=28565 RepID=UPI003743D94D
MSWLMMKGMMKLYRNHGQTQPAIQAAGPVSVERDPGANKTARSGVKSTQSDSKPFSKSRLPKRFVTDNSALGSVLSSSQRTGIPPPCRVMTPRTSSIDCY